MKDVTGSAGFSLAIIFVAFGAYLKSVGFDIWQSMAMNILIYAIPGQLVALNSIVAEFSIISSVLLVLAINIRLLPMSLSLSHTLKRGEHSKTLYYFSSYFVAVTGWMNFINNYRDIDTKDIFRYFLYSSILLWCFAMAGLFVGYYLIDYVSYELFVALLLVNPLYFLAVVAAHGRDDIYLAISVVGGCLFYLLFFELFGASALIIAGILGGTIAFAFHMYNNRTSNKDK